MPDRTKAPRIAPLFNPSILPYRRKLLPNQVEIVYIHDPAQEAFKMDVTFEAGAYYQKHPLAALTAITMLNEGTRHHSAAEIAENFDYYGAYVDFNGGLNRSEINLISLCKYAKETISMIAEMAKESVVPEKELDIFLRNKQQEFLISQEKTAYLVRKKFSALLFGEAHPYANRITEKDFTTLTAPMVRDFYRQHIHALQCRISISGNVGEQILAEVEKHFSSLGIPEILPEKPVYPFNPASAGRYHIHKENAVQSSLRIGKEGVRLTEEDYAAFQLLNTVLGGYFGSRLMTNIREEKGYTYGIHSFNVSLPLSSYWCIASDVNKEYTEATIEETLKEIRKLQTELIPEEELRLVKNFLQGDLLRELDGVFAQSDSLKHKLNYGLDNQFYISLIEKINRCTAAELRDLANKYWNTDDLYIVTAGEQA